MHEEDTGHGRHPAVCRSSPLPPDFLCHLRAASLSRNSLGFLLQDVVLMVQGCVKPSTLVGDLTL